MVHVPFVTIKAIGLLLGLAIAILAFLAFRRNHNRLMFFLALGFGLLALGSFLEAILLEILEVDLLTSHTIESTFVLAGLAAIAILLRPRIFPRAKEAQ